MQGRLLLCASAVVEQKIVDARLLIIRPFFLDESHQMRLPRLPNLVTSLLHRRLCLQRMLTESQAGEQESSSLHAPVEDHARSVKHSLTTLFDAGKVSLIFAAGQLLVVAVDKQHVAHGIQQHLVQFEAPARVNVEHDGHDQVRGVAAVLQHQVGFVHEMPAQQLASIRVGH